MSRLALHVDEPSPGAYTVAIEQFGGAQFLVMTRTHRGLSAEGRTFDLADLKDMIVILTGFVARQELVKNPVPLDDVTAAANA